MSVHTRDTISYETEHGFYSARNYYLTVLIFPIYLIHLQRVTSMRTSCFCTFDGVHTAVLPIILISFASFYRKIEEKRRLIILTWKNYTKFILIRLTWALWHICQIKSKTIFWRNAEVISNQDIITTDFNTFRRRSFSALFKRKLNTTIDNFI